MNRSVWLWVGLLGAHVGLAQAQDARPRVQTKTSLSLNRGVTKEHADQLDQGMRIAPVITKFEALPQVLNAPKVEVGLEPLEAGAIVYHALAGQTANDAASAQVSITFAVKNLTSKELTLSKVRFEAGDQSKEFAVSGVSGASNATLRWQNGREYHAEGEVFYLNAPIANSLTLKLYFEGYSVPVSVTKPLKPYARAFALPFKASDLKADEVWEGGSTHGGGNQVFAYDLGVHGYDKGAFSGLLPGKDQAKNENYRVYGRPIYAMADGEVVQAVNDCADNPFPARNDADMEKQKTHYWGSCTSGGAGNHIYIRHGDVIALYAHMQKGSLSASVLSAGAKVKRGDKLGLAGNSGNSSAPHLHVHIRKETKLETGPYRPLLFNEGFVISKTAYSAPSSNVAWSKLVGQGFPGRASARSYIWPSSAHPYCAYGTGGKEIARHAVAAADYQKEFDKAWTCGFYPSWVDGFDVGGKTYFNLVLRPDDGKAWVARHNLTGAQYQAEFNKWAEAGYRLTQVDSYLRAGQTNYVAIWRKDGGPAITAYHGVSAAQHQAKFEELTQAGWVPVSTSVVAPGGKTAITALYHKLNVGGLYAHTGLSAEQYKAKFKEYGDQGFKLVYLNGYTHSGAAKLSAIWHKTPGFDAYISKHYLTSPQYQTEYNAQTGAGFSTRLATGYAAGNTARFEGLWVK